MAELDLTKLFPQDKVRTLVGITATIKTKKAQKVMGEEQGQDKDIVELKAGMLVEPGALPPVIGDLLATTTKDDGMPKSIKLKRQRTDGTVKMTADKKALDVDGTMIIEALEPGDNGMVVVKIKAELPLSGQTASHVAKMREMETAGKKVSVALSGFQTNLPLEGDE